MTRILGALLIACALAVAASAQDPDVAADNKKAADEVRAKIKGLENAPADSVFENIKVMKGMPAGRLVTAMELGFSPALGVKCSHCHVDGKWASEDKKQKQIARDMMAMARTINDSLLAKVPNLESKKPQVTCTTCHRGQIKPATTMH